MIIMRYVGVGILLSICLAACSPGEAPITAGQAPIAEPPAVEAIVGEWLFDRWFHSSGINERPESIIRQFYHHIKAYNYDGMRTMVTPGFRVMYSGQSLDWERFEEFHRAEEAEEGPASSRPERFLYELSDFQIESTPEVVYATFLQTSHEVDRDYWNLFVLRRIGSDWRVHFVGSLQGAEQVP